MPSVRSAHLRVPVLALALVAGAVPGVPAAAQDASPIPGPDAAPVVRGVGCDALAAGGPIALAAEVAPGTPLILELCADPATGYRWSDPVAADPAVAEVAGWVYLAPADAPAGAPGRERILVRPRLPGVTVVTTTYARPWEVAAEDAPRVELSVTVGDSAHPAVAASPGPVRDAAGVRVELGAIELLLPPGSRVRITTPWTELAGEDPPFIETTRLREDLRWWIRAEVRLPGGAEERLKVVLLDPGAAVRGVDAQDLPRWGHEVRRTTDRWTVPLGDRDLSIEPTDDGSVLLLAIE